MATDDSFIVREDRDKSLVCGLADWARGLQRDYCSWIEDEIREHQTKIEALEVAAGDEGIVEELQDAKEAMEHILRYQLPKAKATLREKCREIEDGGYDSVVDAQGWVQDGIGRFESIASHILRIRASINEHWNVGKE